MQTKWRGSTRNLRSVVSIGICLLLWPVDLPAQGLRRPRPPRQVEQPRASSPARARVGPYFGPQEKVPVREVQIVGNRNVSEAKIRSYLKTRPDSIYDPELEQADVRALYASGLFHDVKSRKRKVPGGIVVTYQVSERTTIGYVRFVSADGTKGKYVGKKKGDKVLLKESGLKVGDALNAYGVDEAKRLLEEFYLKKGFTHAKIDVLEGNQPTDQGVAFGIFEGPMQRIAKTKFEGNDFVGDERLKFAAGVQSKPGFLWLFKGKVNYQAIQEDKQRIINYYRGYGFLDAKVEERLQWKDPQEQEWLTLTFVIDEGPRFRIRDIQFEGNQVYATEDLMNSLEVKPGDFYDRAMLQSDQNTLTDLYGSNGYINVDIQKRTVYQPEPGQLDLVYSIDEGHQFRVGRIFINIHGEDPQTKLSVVRNRLSLRPGQIVDIREMRASERRLQASQLFVRDPSRGTPPQVAVKPSDQDYAEVFTQRPAPQPRRTFFRGQDPKSAPKLAPRRVHENRVHTLDFYFHVNPER